MFYAILLAFQPLLALAASDSTGILELDLVFPRNDTYAPIAEMPVVFAVQNPTLLSALDTHIEWSVWDSANRTAPGAYPNNVINLSELDSTSLGDPYLPVGRIPTLFSIESTWVFQWTVSTGNCSQSAGTPGYDNQVSFIVFTTSNSAQPPNLEEATAASTCASTQGYAFNVTGVQQVPLPQDFDGQSSCAVLGPTPTTRNPCAVSIGPSAASSISASISLAACEATHVGCTATPTAGKSAAGLIATSPAFPAIFVAVASFALFWAA